MRTIMTMRMATHCAPDCGHDHAMRPRSPRPCLRRCRAATTPIPSGHLHGIGSFCLTFDKPLDGAGDVERHCSSSPSSTAKAAARERHPQHQGPGEAVRRARRAAHLLSARHARSAGRARTAARASSSSPRTCRKKASASTSAPSSVRRMERWWRARRRRRRACSASGATCLWHVSDMTPRPNHAGGVSSTRRTPPEPPPFIYLEIARADAPCA